MIKWFNNLFKVKIWTIYHADLGNGYSVTEDELDSFLEEILYDTAEFMDDYGVDVVKNILHHIRCFVCDARRMNVGDSISLEHWTIKCSELTRKEFNNMKEWEGW